MFISGSLMKTYNGYTILKFKINKKKHIKEGLRIELSNEDSGFIQDLVADVDKIKKPSFRLCRFSIFFK